MEEKVLIAGAGPTGLVLALWLSKLGILLRIIDKDRGPGETSRAMVIHARTLEFYQQIGIADEIISKGIIVEKIQLRKKSKLTATVALGALGKGLSPFPFVLSLPQDEHEKLLIQQLHKQNVIVERNTELIAFVEENNQIKATLKKENTTETVITPYLFGCDGARSIVRRVLNIPFVGGTYSQLFYVADVMANGDLVNGDLNLCLKDTGFSLVFPIRTSGSVRLIGIVPEENVQANIQFSNIEPAIHQDMDLSISKLNWFSTYHSHHRVAQHFQHECAFLLGDAGHIHSPVGGQGMNTGIGDAINLAWKIAAVMQNRATKSLLNTYEIERIRFAQRLIATTDTVFQAVTNQGLLGKFFRDIFFPYLFPLLTKIPHIKKYLFKFVSQTTINYRHSPLSKGQAGHLKSGDRLPWVNIANVDNFKSLTLLDWQIHIYGEANSAFKNAMEKLNLPLHVFVWHNDIKKTGLKKDVVYLVRPDGYIAYIHATQDSHAIAQYFSENHIKLNA